MNPLFLESWARPMLVVHALLAFVSLGSSLHAAVLGVIALRGGSPSARLFRLLRLHGALAPAAFTSTFLLGLAMYPTFRVRVRGLVLDATAPWASNAFDFKEALVLVGIPCAVALFVATRIDDVRGVDGARAVIAALAVALAVILCTVTVLGLVVTSVRGPS